MRGPVRCVVVEKPAWVSWQKIGWRYRVALAGLARPNWLAGPAREKKQILAKRARILVPKKMTAATGPRRRRGWARSKERGGAHRIAHHAVAVARAVRALFGKE
ncbi:hypothetical protein PG990_014516 [Apiospora arundinis]|uniref:Uncharacterized protein n=1 Tax=Apiospora arundinis TaxID=335852 RepID=A0ABR2HJC5_9PEZI